MWRTLLNVTLDFGLLWVAGAVGIPLMLLGASVSMWKENQEAAVALAVVSGIVAIIAWPPVVANVQECREIKSTPTTTTEFERRVINGKTYWVPKQVVDDKRRIDLLEKNCSDFPYNV